MSCRNESTPPAAGSGSSPACPPGVTPCPLEPEYHLHVDANRDGTVDDDRTGIDSWNWGAGNKGAIVMCNNDDDSGRSLTDNSDNQVNGGNDSSELAPFELRRTGPPPPGDWTGELELSATDAACVHVFDSQAAGSTVILGQGAVNTYHMPDLNFTSKRYWMEATRYAGAGFSGEITLTFRLKKAGVTASEETAKFRVSPWMMPNHRDPATKIFVVNAGATNSRFRSDLNTLVSGAGCTLQQHSSNDIWMQDCMELGFSKIPGGSAMPVVMRAPRYRPLMSFPPTLLAADFGLVKPGTTPPPPPAPPSYTTFDSTGNLECTPPVTSAAGKRYPFGRIYHGPGRPAELMDPDTVAFLNGQIVQEPIEIDTGWLAVGHVDEIISFVPAPTPKGFKLLLASPKLARKILKDNKAAHGSSHLLTGRSFPRGPSGTLFGAEVSIRDFLDVGLPSGITFLDAAGLKTFNANCQASLDGVRTQLKSELGLAESDIIDVPIIFVPNEDLPTLADALTAGMVNMLVINGHCIVPKPFGPVVGGQDLFEKHMLDNLTPLGATVHFLDDWMEYHVALGEVHCGTNTLRTPASTDWWTFVP